MIPSFIRGYFDGDGSVGLYNNRIKFTIIGTIDIVEKIRSFFTKQGIKTIPKIGKKKNIYSIQYNSQSDIKQIYSILYGDCSERYLIRKKLIFDKYFKLWQ